jgi:spore coat-associated protein N
MMFKRGKHSPSQRPNYARRAIAAGFATSVLLLTSAGVYAALTATATGTSAVTSGTLLMTLSKDGTSGGLPETVTAMAPGDVYNVYVNLNNTGTLASAAGMTLGAAANPVTALTNGSIAGEGLTVTVTQCSVAWTATGACSGATTSILASTLLSAFGSPRALSNVASLVASTGQLAHLQFSLSLAGTETSTNGVLPAPTIQGLSTTVTWTFTEQQRTGQTTNA